MNKELEDKLAEDFPFMRQTESLSRQLEEGHIGDLYGAFGCECDNGWFDLIYSLCTEITGVYKKYGIPIDITVEQVKEKYGSLRFYYSVQKPNHETVFSDKEKEAHNDVRKLVNQWEKKSETVCEKCGKPGKLREDLPWIQTLCDECCSEKTSKKK